MATSKRPTSFRLDDETKLMLARLADYRGGSATTLLAQLIREAFFAARKDIERYEKGKQKK